MIKIFKFLKNYKVESVLGPLFKLLEASFELLVPLVMASIIDKGIANADKPYIFKLGGVLILLGIIGLVFSITAQFFAAKAAVGFSTELKHSLFVHIQKLSFREMDTLGTSTLITRMTSDVNQVQSSVNMVLRLFLRSPFIVIGAMVMAFTINGKAAFIFVVTISVLSVAVFGIMIITIPMYRKVQEQLDGILGITRENLTGIRVIRAFNKQDEEIETFEKQNAILTKMQQLVGRISGVMNPITYIIINIAIIALLWSGALQVNIGNISQGELVALVNYMSQILVELVKLASLIITVTKSVACANRIADIFEVSRSIQDQHIEENSKHLRTNNTTENLVDFKQVSMRYNENSGYALEKIDFHVKKGQVIGIIGGTGSGKSTIVNLIPRFYDTSEGEVCIKGKNVKNYSVTELRDMFGFVLQKVVLFRGTIRENLAWGKKEPSDEECWEALDFAQAKEFVEEKDNQLDAIVAQGGKNLSGGQRQRLTIARALIRKPEIVILDDSASALDFATEAKLRQSIRKMKPTPTLFIVSQRAASIQYADQIIVLDKGKMVGIGTHENLIKNCDVYQEIFYSQFKKEESYNEA